MKYNNLYIALVLISIFWGCTQEEKKNIVKTKMIDEFGFNTDSLEIFDGIISSNETISNILAEYNLPQNKIDEVVALAKPHFDITKIKADNNYKIYYTNSDTAAFVRYFVYEIDPINYLIADIGKTTKVYKISKDIKIKEKVATGRIDYALFSTLQKKNIPISLAFSLAEVYAWQIDFYRIMPGDSFKVVYEEKQVDGKYVGIGKIKTAYFSHNKKDYFAFYYQQNGQWAYFDDKGNSLKKQFLKSPLKFTRISSNFTFARLHPVLNRYMPHTGIDYAAPNGTPVRAIGDGVVTFAQNSGAAGKYIKIKHNSNYMSGYMHLSGFGKGIKPGARVAQGDIIGYVGSSGRSTGPHLDFRFWINNQPKNYLAFEFPPIKPIEEKNRKHFSDIKSGWLKFLQKIKIIETEKTAILSKP